MNDQTEQPQERQFVVGEELLQKILNVLGEQKLKDSLDVYMSIQQGVRPLENSTGGVPGDPSED